MIAGAERVVARLVVVVSVFVLHGLCATAWAQQAEQHAEKVIFVDAVATGDLASDAGKSFRADVSVPVGAHAELGDELHFSGTGSRFVNPWARYMVSCHLCPAHVHPFVSGRFEMEHRAVDALVGARIETSNARWSIVAEEGVVLREAEHASVHMLSFELGLSYRIAR